MDMKKSILDPATEDNSDKSFMGVLVKETSFLHQKNRNWGNFSKLSNIHTRSGGLQ